MHKKIATELVSLANSILQLENKDDVLVLHKKAQEIYEKLTVLKFVNENISKTILSEETPIVSEKVEEIAVETPIIPFEEEKEVTKEPSEIITEVTDVPIADEKNEAIEESEIPSSLLKEETEIEEEIIAETINELIDEEEIVVVGSIDVIDDFEEEIVLEEEEDELEEEIIVQTINDIDEEETVVVGTINVIDDFEEEIVLDAEEDEVEEISLFEIEKAIDLEESIAKSPLRLNFEEEFKDAVSADIAAMMFEKVTKESPVVEPKKVEEVKKRSINDVLYSTNIQIGLNDRIAFVKYLFDGSQEDFNRVLSQLNSFKTADEALEFIINFVKPDYNWKNKEEYEERLLNIIQRKFS